MQGLIFRFCGKICILIQKQKNVNEIEEKDDQDDLGEVDGKIVDTESENMNMTLG